MVHDFLSGRPPSGEGKNYAGVKMTWLRQRVQATPRDGASPSLCPPGRDLFVFPIVSRLNGLGQSSREHHSRRMLDLRNELDRVGFDDFVWTPYILPTWRDIEPD
ncbi:hypothetical protein PIB30_084218 [Stylosanthes scabra]|uniref:Uncharacterized protein n=1 Tax=Stylosanthes scabra TaxID=79078 RepID=A0ABU6USM2_9FABA|nr:hypothetical protein [Stylosanthes scabra]